MTDDAHIYIVLKIRKSSVTADNMVTVGDRAQQDSIHHYMLRIRHFNCGLH